MSSLNTNLPKKTELWVKKIIEEKGEISIKDMVEGKIKIHNLHPLLLKTFENITEEINVNDILDKYQKNSLVQPCSVDQKELTSLDYLAYSIIPAKFKPVELSPLSPLGINGVLTKNSQKKVLSTIRSAEVNADATTALAMECAKKRKLSLQDTTKMSEEVNLCTSHRSVRLQKFNESSGFRSHFRTFALCTAGKDAGSEIFEAKGMIEHIDFYLTLIKELAEKSYSFSDVIVRTSDIRITEKIINKFKVNREKLTKNTQTKNFKPFADYEVKIPETINSIDDLETNIIKMYEMEIVANSLMHIQHKAVHILEEKHHDVKFELDLHRISGIGYYDNLCFKITAKNKDGKEFPLADGGLTDWTQKILNNKKEKLFVSGFGSELFCDNFKK